MFLLFCVTNWEITHKALLLYTEYWDCLEEKHLCNCLRYKLDNFIVIKHHFYLKEPMTDDGYSALRIWHTFS